VGTCLHRTVRIRSTRIHGRWWVLMDSEVRVCGFLKLFGIYLAGDTINYVVPSGEPGGNREGLSSAGGTRLWSGAHFDCDSQARGVGCPMDTTGRRLGICLTYFELPTS
jgi:hypothetical protein